MKVGRKPINAPTSLARVSIRAKKHFKRVKSNTGMTEREQVDEMIVLLKWVLAHQQETVGFGTLKSSLNRCLKDHKKQKTPMSEDYE